MDIYCQAQYAMARYHTRRHFLKKCMPGMGDMALG